jgi:D-alanyl-D-alanine carboxypeptidase
VTVYATLLGSPSREQRNEDLTRLISWGLARYRFVSLVVRGRVYADASTGYGRGNLRLVAARPLRRAVRAGRAVVEHVVAPRSVALPVSKDERLGEVRVYVGGRLVGRRALVADRSVSRPSLPGRVGWYVGETVHEVWSWFT